MLKISVNQPFILPMGNKNNDLSPFKSGFILYVLLLLIIASGFFLLACHLLHANFEAGERCFLRELLTCCFTLVCLFLGFSTAGRFINEEEGCVLKWISTTRKLAQLGKNDFEL